MANSTVNLPTKALMARLVSCRVVLWALATHGPRLAEINGSLANALPEGIRGFFDEQITRMQEVLSAARDLLIESDRKQRDQRAKTTRFRQLRDAAFKELFPHVMGIKDIFRGAYGDTVAAELGFALRVPAQAGELHEQATHLLARLSEPVELPSVRYQGVLLDPLSVVEEMRPKVERLGVALEDVTREERRSDAMKIAKDEALSAYDRSFQWVAGSAQSLFKMADLPEIAKRVRPSVRRRGVTVEVETQGPEIPIEGPESSAGEAAGEEPEASERARPDRPPADEADAPSATA